MCFWCGIVLMQIRIQIIFGNAENEMLNVILFWHVRFLQLYANYLFCEYSWQEAVLVIYKLRLFKFKQLMRAHTTHSTLLNAHSIFKIMGWLLLRFLTCCMLTARAATIWHNISLLIFFHYMFFSLSIKLVTERASTVSCSHFGSRNFNNNNDKMKKQKPNNKNCKTSSE